MTPKRTVDFFLLSLIDLQIFLGYYGSFAIEAVVAMFTEDRLPESRRLELEARGVNIEAMGERKLFEFYIFFS